MVLLTSHCGNISDQVFLVLPSLVGLAYPGAGPRGEGRPGHERGLGAFSRKGFLVGSCEFLDVSVTQGLLDVAAVGLVGGVLG